MQSTPDRVRDLIRGSGLSQHDFAVRVGLDDSKLSKSLSGARRFSSLDLAQIADLAKVTVDWLITGEEPPLAMAARTTGGSAGDAVRVATRLSRLRGDMATLGYPQPWHAVELHPGAGMPAAQGSRLADAALELVQGSPGADLVALVEDVFGVDVAVADLGVDFDGLASASEAAKIIVLATSHVPSRQRFTLAHELGHLLPGDDQELHLDRDVYDRSRAKDPTELRANAFAAAFLMPASVLHAAVGSRGLTLESFADLSWSLRVTPSALAFRLLALRLIDAGSCDRFKTLTGAKAASICGRSEEFARLVTKARTPRPPGLLVKDTYAAYDVGKTTLRPYANLIGVDVDELRRALETEGGEGS